MSHFSVLVITPPSQKPLKDILTEALQPYHEFECDGTDDQYVQDVDVTEECREQSIEYHGLEDSTVSDESQVDRSDKHKYGYAIMDGDTLVKAVNRTNPNKKWDYWMVGGRYSNRLLTKTGTRCDSALKGELDFNALAFQKSTDTTHEWNLAQVAFGDTPPSEPWAIIRERHKDNIDKAREEYHAQPRVKVWKEATRNSRLFGWDSGPEDYQVPLAEFLAPKVHALTAFAVVKDGQWYERGSMGWWGCVSDEQDEGAWNTHVTELLNTVPDDHTITVVDCHI